MARITVEDCLEKENNRFALVRLAAVRTKQLLRGAEPLVKEGRANKAVVSALREIAAGKVAFLTPEEEVLHLEDIAREEQERREEAELLQRMNTTVIPFRGGAGFDAPKSGGDGEEGEESESLPSLFGEGLSLFGQKTGQSSSAGASDDDDDDDDVIDDVIDDVVDDDDGEDVGGIDDVD